MRTIVLRGKCALRITGGTRVARVCTMRAWPVLLLIATPVHAGAPIIGGTNVPPGKWPDTVAVVGAQGMCSGTLIAPDVVLTAGHCTDVNPTQVIANTTDYAAQGGTHVNVTSITAYPSWQTQYDVSVVVLASPVTGVQPRAVGTACTFANFTASSQVHLVGFGLTDTAAAGTNTRLNEVMAPVTDPTCSGGNGCQAAVSPGGEFVAGGNGIDSCNGDSGGPVYLDTPRGPIVIGAVSRSVDGAATPCGGGGIYVRTDKVVQWLEQTSGKTIAKDECTTTPPGGGSGSGSNPDPTGTQPGIDDQTVTGGCAATHGSGWLVALALLVRRKSSKLGRSDNIRPDSAR
jgi:secreted trypsin-like serine protease